MIQLYNDDCLNVMKSMQSNSVDLICTDIPYELNKHGGTTTALAKRNARVRDEVDFMSHGIDYDSVFSEFIRVCKVPNIITFCSNLQIGKIITWFNEHKLKTDVLVWAKTNPAPLCNNKYISDLEYIIYAHTTGSHFNNDAEFRQKKKCKQYPIVTKKDKFHPTTKPLNLMSDLISVHSFEDDLVLDPFMGGCSTGVVCKNLNRNFIGIEIDTKYFNIAKERLGLAAN